MRIAMVGVRGIPAHVGGAERVAEELTRELSARGHEVLVYGRAGYLAGSPPPPAGTCLLTPGLAGKHLEAITHTATALLDAVRRRVDVVHIHSVGPAALSWLAAARGTPIVWTIHAPDWRRAKWSPAAKALLRAAVRVGMRFADEVSAVSRPLADELSRRWGREVAYVPNAARPAEPAPPSTLRRWALRPQEYVLTVGRVEPEKRLGMLLDVWPQVPRPWRLVVVGDARATAYGRRCLRRGRAGNVLFVGPQTGATLSALYAHAAVVAHPSMLEGMSLVLLEAAALGRCIAAADIPANRAALGEAAVYFATAPELLAQLCRCCRQAAMRTDLGRKAKSLVAARYSWSRSADQIEQLYRRALERSGDRR